jgi:hypothetical protein
LPAPEVDICGSEIIDALVVCASALPFGPGLQGLFPIQYEVRIKPPGREYVELGVEGHGRIYRLVGKETPDGLIITRVCLQVKECRDVSVKMRIDGQSGVFFVGAAEQATKSDRILVPTFNGTWKQPTGIFALLQDWAVRIEVGIQ